MKNEIIYACLNAYSSLYTSQKYVILCLPTQTYPVINEVMPVQDTHRRKLVESQTVRVRYYRPERTGYCKSHREAA